MTNLKITKDNKKEEEELKVEPDLDYGDYDYINGTEEDFDDFDDLGAVIEIKKKRKAKIKTRIKPESEGKHECDELQANNSVNTVIYKGTQASWRAYMHKAQMNRNNKKNVKNVKNVHSIVTIIEDRIRNGSKSKATKHKKNEFSNGINNGSGTSVTSGTTAKSRRIFDDMNSDESDISEFEVLALPSVPEKLCNAVSPKSL